MLDTARQQVLWVWPLLSDYCRSKLRYRLNTPSFDRQDAAVQCDNRITETWAQGSGVESFADAS